MLYFQSPNFEHLNLNKLDQRANPLPVTEWTPIVRKHAQNEGFQTFVDTFMYTAYMYTAYIVIHGDHPLRLFLECKELLRLSPDTRVGDCSLF